jgi:hypothetical protein
VLLDLLTVAVLVYVGTRLAGAARVVVGGEYRGRAAAVLRGLRPRHFLFAWPALAAVLAMSVALVQVPGLDWGWWTAIGGTGNPVVGSTTRTQGTVLEWAVPVAFLLLLVPALPLLVEREEQAFRAGSERRSRWGQVRAAVVFGLVHALVGIPVGVALALSVGGAYLTWAYLRGYRRGGPAAGLLESTRAHLAYNLTIVALVLAALATGV